MQIIIDIKDGYEVAIAKALGFSYPQDNVPPIEEHLAAIESKIYDMINPLYEKAVLQDPDVIAKDAELKALITQKLNIK